MSYGLDDFDVFGPLPTTNTSAPKKASSGRRVGVDALPISDDVKALIRNGRDPERHPSDSEVVWAVACAMARAGCDDDLIVSVLLDPMLKISAHVLRQSNPSAYARRQATKARAEVEDGHTLNDAGNAQRLIARHGDQILYCSHFKCWFLWDGTRWERDDAGRISQLCTDTAKSIFGEAARAGDPDAIKAISSWANKSLMQARLEAMAALARPMAHVDAADLDARPELLNLMNGTLHLETLTLREHDADDLLTKRIDVELDPKAECPRWEQFQKEICSADEELIAYKQRAFGYALSGDTGEQVVIFCHGSGANGKSTELNVMRELLGPYACTADPRTFMHRDRQGEGANEDVAALRGARFVLAMETGDGQRLNEQLIKQATGGDAIRARRLYENSFEFLPQFQLFFAMNHLPDVRGVDEAIWRRIHAVPYPVTIPPDERDGDLPKKLREELPGIMNWVIAGLRQWRERRLAPPDVVRAYTDEYREEQDVVGQFLGAATILGDMETPVDQTYDAYEEWCDENGHQPIHKKTFGRRMKDHGIASKVAKVAGKAKRVYVGIGLLDEDRQDHEQRDFDDAPGGM